MTGAVIGGAFLMYLPVAQSEHPGIAGLLFAILGFGAVALGRDPNGLANRLFGLRPWIEESVYPLLSRRFPGMALGGGGGSGGAATADGPTEHTEHTEHTGAPESLDADLAGEVSDDVVAAPR